jgi:hypothetical protein
VRCLKWPGRESVSPSAEADLVALSGPGAGCYLRRTGRRHDDRAGMLADRSWPVACPAACGPKAGRSAAKRPWFPARMLGTVDVRHGRCRRPPGQ